ncbi:hypothetical protein, partial [Amycolatopsis taiwanensis]|uniref:hypothetical protein n=1 Tax=Amycolatopsis taiwanensis TaxID=342230 RepID=UPI00048740F1
MPKRRFRAVRRRRRTGTLALAGFAGGVTLGALTATLIAGGHDQPTQKGDTQPIAQALPQALQDMINEYLDEHGYHPGEGHDPKQAEQVPAVLDKAPVEVPAPLAPTSVTAIPVPMAPVSTRTGSGYSPLDPLGDLLSQYVVAKRDPLHASAQIGPVSVEADVNAEPLSALAETAVEPLVAPDWTGVRPFGAPDGIPVGPTVLSEPVEPFTYAVSDKRDVEPL